MAAVTDAYVTAPEYRAAIVKTTTTVDAAILADLKAASRLIEAETGQFFMKDATAVARVFIAKYTDLLDLNYEGNCPGIATTSGVEIKVDTDSDDSFADETAWALSDYDLYPLQANMGAEPAPWSSIRVRRGGSKSFIPGGKVQVTAVFGWPAVPEAIKRACIELTGIIRNETPRAFGSTNLSTNVEQPLSRTSKGIIQELLDAYPRMVTL